MKFLKKVISLILTLSIALPLLAVPASAADNMSEAKKYADILHEAGLFDGYGTDASGNPIYALERTATRAEAIVMLVRVLGKTEAAKTAPRSPFTDVPAWAAPAVNYAYANKLTKGVGGGKFGSNQAITINEYMTFLLRALDYSDDVWSDYCTAVEYFGSRVPDDDYYRNQRYQSADGTQKCTRATMVTATYEALLTVKNYSVDRLEETLGLDLAVEESYSQVLWYEKTYRLPHINTGNPLIDKRVSILDLDSPGRPHFFVDDEKGVYELSIWYKPPISPPYGSLFQGGTYLLGSEFAYDPGLSKRANTERVSHMIEALDCNGLLREDKDVPNFMHFGVPTDTYEYSSYGYISYLVPRDTVEIRTEMGCNWGRTDYRNQHTFFLNALAYFDRDMAVRLYAMLYDYYFYSSARYVSAEYDDDGSTLIKAPEIINDEGPFTAEFVSRYGLTLLSQEPHYRPYDSCSIAVLTNGTATWTVEYDLPNVRWSSYVYVRL